MKLTLRIWRQKDPQDKGRMVTYEVTDVSPDMSFLEMLDVLNERLIAKARTRSRSTTTAARASAACAAWSSTASPHGPEQLTTTCQLHMRHFKDGDEITIEPWRAQRLPGRQGPGGRPLRVRPDHPGRRIHLGADRQRTGRQRHPGAKGGRGRSRWTPPPASAAAPAWPPAPTPRRCSFTAAKVSHLGLLPQGQPERDDPGARHGGRARRGGFGGCTNTGECEAVCPKGIR